MGMTTMILRAGVPLPFPPYIRRVLSAFNLAPTQLVPNAWRVIMGLWVLWRKLGFSEPSITEIQDLFYIQPIAKNVGWDFLSSVRGRAFFRGQKKTNHAWKKLFFLLDGKWEFEDNDPKPDIRVLRNYCPACRRRYHL
ncbi:Collagen alpha-1(VII) chain like [Melia azedarach]|uniref:Collagen alpha-1(VII) chain like n=1 Tax=Melia azedarach TaxID=155640 RepID=A0ACC1XY59_MELAZ|nr:Collagen alpha-1(VII) chain like [Melia azedarach]